MCNPFISWTICLPRFHPRQHLVVLTVTPFSQAAPFSWGKHLAKWFVPPHFRHSFLKARHCFGAYFNPHLSQFPLSCLGLVSFFFTSVVALGFVHWTASTSLLKVLICAFALSDVWQILIAFSRVRSVSFNKCIYSLLSWTPTTVWSLIMESHSGPKSHDWLFNCRSVT